MKRLSLSIITVFTCLSLLAQVPESFNYQVVVRDGSNNPLQNQNVSFRFTILKGSIVKSTVFTEKHSAITNSLGLVSLAIGDGTNQTGSIVTIDWGADDYFLKVEIDPTGGSGFIEMGTTQLLSVPYARHSRFADTAFTHFEVDPMFIIHPSYGISSGNIEDWTEAHNWGNHALMGYVPGIRTLTINGTTLDLTTNRNWNVGTVTSVDLSMPAIFSISGSPVTGSGTLSAALVSQEHNLVFASPDGSSGVPAFRSLAVADIPNLDWTKITTGKPTSLEGYGITDGVNTTGNQIIAGNKTFTGTTTVQAPVSTTDAATKAYVDALLARIEKLEDVLQIIIITDSRDGNQYYAVKIGNQIWMAENLKYLPNIVGPATASNTTPYYHVYGYDGTDVNAAKATSNYTAYRVLYDWPAAMNGAGSSSSNPSGVQGACPTGWHLPSDAEWNELFIYLGSDIGGKLKETGTSHWNSPNTGATNESGFTALPGGSRSATSVFNDIGAQGNWWPSTESGSTTVWFYMIRYDNSGIASGNYHKADGFSVRCIKD